MHRESKNLGRIHSFSVWILVTPCENQQLLLLFIIIVVVVVIIIITTIIIIFGWSLVTIC